MSNDNQYKLATWNVNSLKVRLEHLEYWLNKFEPDVLGLQETKTIDENFPADDIKAMGYEVVYTGQKTYNGVAILSKHPMTDVITDLPNVFIDDVDDTGNPNPADPQRRFIAATIDIHGTAVRFINVYIPNGESLESDKFIYKMKWLAALKKQMEQELATHENVVLVGDYNITPTDDDLHNIEKLSGKVHASAPEREWLQSIYDLGLTDCFRKFNQKTDVYSWWDYRNGDFWKNRGLLIDHILASESMQANCVECKIDKRIRMKKRPSDHAPVIATFKSGLL